MRQLLNHYSFVWLGLFLLAIVAAVTWRVRRPWLRAAIPGALAAGLVVGFVMLRTGGGNVHAVTDVDTALASGKPVMLEFFSDY